MNVTIPMTDLGKVSVAVSRMRPAGRAQLHNVAGNAVAALVQRHIADYARSKHRTAASLGAAKTHHYEHGAAAITASSSATKAEVVIPIAGISRAFHDLDIRPVKARSLTLPKRGEAYGHTARELEMRGWQLFTTKRFPGILFGKRGTGKHTVVRALFSLVKKVHQPKDPSLLPTMDEMKSTFARSMQDEIVRILRKAATK